MATTAEIKAAKRDELDQIALTHDVDPTVYSNADDLRAFLLPLADDYVAPEDDDESDLEYYKSSIATLEVVIGSPDPTKGEIAPKVVRFEPYWEMKLGVEGRFKVGYLATSEISAIEKLEVDPNVTKISKAEYDKATTEKFDSDNVQTHGQRAPF